MSTYNACIHTYNVCIHYIHSHCQRSSIHYVYIHIHIYIYTYIHTYCIQFVYIHTYWQRSTTRDTIERSICIHTMYVYIHTMYVYTICTPNGSGAPPETPSSALSHGSPPVPENNEQEEKERWICVPPE